jgi:hypothetical protein
MFDFDMHRDLMHTHLKSILGSQQYTQKSHILNYEDKHIDMPNYLAQWKVKPTIISYKSTHEFQAQNHFFLNHEQWAPVPGKLAQFIYIENVPKYKGNLTQ